MAVNDHIFAIEYVTGAGGAGKTMGTVRYYARERMLDVERRLTCNLPLTDKFYEYVANKTGETSDQVRERVTILTDGTLKRWRQGEGGPWELSDEGTDHLMGDLVIDEIHAYCPKGKCPNFDKWEDFLGQGRHYGWERMRFLTQAEQKVNPTIEAHAHNKFTIVRGDTGRIPTIGIAWADWYQLLASATGHYTPLISRVEYGRDGKGSWQEQNRDLVTVDTEIGSLYHTHTGAGGGTTGKKFSRQMDWEWRPRLLPWFVKRHEHAPAEFTFPTWLWVSFRIGWRWLYLGPLLAALALILTGDMRTVVDVVKMPVDSIQQGMIEGMREKQGQPPIEPQEAKPYELDTTGLEEDDLGLVEELLEVLEAAEPSAFEGVRLSAVGFDYVSFSDGDTYRVGEVIEHGPLKGIKVETIDRHRLRCELDDGRWLRLVEDEQEATDRATEVRELVQRARERLEEAGRSRQGGERSVLVNRSVADAPASVRTASREGNRGVDRDGGSTRQPPRFYRSRRPPNR